MSALLNRVNSQERELDYMPDQSTSFLQPAVFAKSSFIQQKEDNDKMRN